METSVEDARLLAIGAAAAKALAGRPLAELTFANYAAARMYATTHLNTDGSPAVRA